MPFGGVRAISKFDWPFTPTLGSSEAFQRLSVRTSIPCYRTSSWPSVDHLVSLRLPPPTQTPCSGSLSLRLGISWFLTLPATATRRFIMQKARRHWLLLRPLVGAWFQELFHLFLIGVLFTFPSRYWFTIGLTGVFSLTGWSWADSRRIPRVPRYRGIPPWFVRGFVWLFTLSEWLSRHSAHLISSGYRSYNPVDQVATTTVWALPGRSPHWGIIIYFLFLQVLRCFSSCVRSLQIHEDDSPSGLTGCPFWKRGSKLVICTYPQLIAAYHVLRRLQSL